MDEKLRQKIEKARTHKEAYIDFVMTYNKIIQNAQRAITTELLDNQKYKVLEKEFTSQIYRHSAIQLEKCRIMVFVMTEIKNCYWCNSWTDKIKFSNNELYILICTVQGRTPEEIAIEMQTSKQVIWNYIKRINNRVAEGIVNQHNKNEFNKIYPEHKIVHNKKYDSYSIKNFSQWITKEILDNIEQCDGCGLIASPYYD